MVFKNTALFSLLVALISPVAMSASNYTMVIPAQGVASTAKTITAQRANVIGDNGEFATKWFTVYCDGGVSCANGWSMPGVTWDKSKPYYEIGWGYEMDYYIDLDFGVVTHFSRVKASTYSPNGYTYNSSLIISTSADPSSGVWTPVATLKMATSTGIDQAINPFDARYVRIQGQGPNLTWPQNTGFGIQFFSN